MRLCTDDRKPDSRTSDSKGNSVRRRMLKWLAITLPWYVALVLGLLVVPAHTEDLQSKNAAPLSAGAIFSWRIHDINEIAPLIYNQGAIYGCEFPSGRHSVFVDIGPLVACVRGVDTLVTFGETQSFAPLRASSSDPDSPLYTPDAKAPQQFYIVFSDTTTPSWSDADEIDLRQHESIGYEGHLTTYAWSDEYSKRFVLADLWIKNISSSPLQKGSVGLRLDPNVFYYPDTWPIEYSPDRIQDNSDDMCGFLRAVPGIVAGVADTINLVWVADNDGNPNSPDGVFTRVSATGVVGIRVLRTPDSTAMAFNWWAVDPEWPYPTLQSWGPRRSSDRVYYRGSQGEPIGDRGIYHMMRNGEIDYNQVETAVNHENEGWAPPPTNSEFARDIADGKDVYAIVSFAPLPDIEPGDSIPLTFAIVGGAGFHQFPNNIENFDPLNPSVYLNNLNFEDLITNARWADWVFDNPGFDTDGDGNRGRAYPVDCSISDCDSVFYKGDGVPDWHGPSAPPSPRFTFSTAPSEIILRWSGARSETFFESFSRQYDFEGYRLYLGQFNADDKYSLLASWDKEDFKRLSYNADSRKWETISYPLRDEDWRLELGDPEFSVYDYLSDSPEQAYRDSVADTVRNASGDIIRLENRERLSYWAPEDYNRTNLYQDGDHTEQNLVKKIGGVDTTVAGKEMTYGLYEARITGLNPSVPLFVAVSAFDFGDYERDLLPIESSRSSNSAHAEFIYSSDAVADSILRVSVFPNPYKSEYLDPWGKRTSYFIEGYEGRGVTEFSEQDRRIHFINLPDTATIRIWTLDGDLVRELHHPDPFLTTYSSSMGWDLISRNGQAVVSGIYIWRVESRLGTQTGKLVIIK